MMAAQTATVVLCSVGSPGVRLITATSLCRVEASDVLIRAETEHGRVWDGKLAWAWRLPLQPRYKRDVEGDGRKERERDPGLLLWGLRLGEAPRHGTVECVLSEVGGFVESTKGVTAKLTIRSASHHHHLDRFN